MSFIPVKDKLKKFVTFDQNQAEKFDYISSIVKDFIRNGHEAHKTIPGYDETKPEIETYMVFYLQLLIIYMMSQNRFGKLIRKDYTRF